MRSVKTPPLDPKALTPPEVERLLRACDSLQEPRRTQFRLVIALGYYSGLDACDIWRMERKHIGKRGAIRYRRGKTGVAVFVRIPSDVLAEIERHCPRKGPLIRLGIGKERFRQIISSLFARARLQGTFKILRKSAGTLVEKHAPGKGHKHLGNSRTIFEKHYEDRGITGDAPTMPPKIRLP